MDAAIDKMPTSATSSIMSEFGDTLTRRRRKRACHFMSEEAVKRQRVSSENIHSFPTGSSPMSLGVQIYVVPVQCAGMCIPFTVDYNRLQETKDSSSHSITQKAWKEIGSRE